MTTAVAEPFSLRITVYFGSSADASPAWKMPQRVATDPGGRQLLPDLAAQVATGRQIMTCVGRDEAGSAAP